MDRALRSYRDGGADIEVRSESGTTVTESFDGPADNGDIREEAVERVVTRLPLPTRSAAARTAFQHEVEFGALAQY